MEEKRGNRRNGEDVSLRCWYGDGEHVLFVASSKLAEHIDKTKVCTKVDEDSVVGKGVIVRKYQGGRKPVI